MENIYGKGTVCRENGECLTLEPDLEQLNANSRDYDELLWAWKGWRDAVGRQIGPLYPQYVELKNKGARANCKTRFFAAAIFACHTGNSTGI